jgi:AraC family transcriptional regulator of adaptative response/methylated-DNA-[protein]-cysteine methyltransferase
MTISTKTEMLAAATVSDPRWAAVLARDPKADGTFFYSVRTTGVYCRPSCAARTARPENVAFHLTVAEAERAGFRPCKRCKPDQPSLAEQHAARVAELCRLIENAEHVPSLEELANHVGLSPYHLHRVFKAVTGLTPKAYAAAHRAKRVRTELGRSSTVTEAIYGAGYSSNGRFYEESNEVLGMTPTNYRAGGANTAIRFALAECSLGSILVAASERGVCAILMGDDPDELARNLQDRFPRADLIGGVAEFERLVAKVVGFVEAPKLGLDLPLGLPALRAPSNLVESSSGRTAKPGQCTRRRHVPIWPPRLRHTDDDPSPTAKKKTASSFARRHPHRLPCHPPSPPFVISRYITRFPYFREVVLNQILTGIIHKRMPVPSF